jgi:hypothetical protein
MATTHARLSAPRLVAPWVGRKHPDLMARQTGPPVSDSNAKELAMKTTIKFALIGALTLLAACGTSEPGRVQGGTATGAATGAAIGIIGGPVGIVAGAAIGAGAGAIASATTRPDQVNLGAPIWHEDRG